MDYNHSDRLMAQVFDDFTKQTGLMLRRCDVNLYHTPNASPILGIDLRFDVLHNGYFPCSLGDFKNIRDMLLMAIHIQKLIGVENIEESELITKLVQENFELRKKLGEASDDLTLEEE